MGAKDEFKAMFERGEISAEELKDALEEFDRIMSGKIHVGLMTRFDGDQQKVADFLLTHHLAHIEEDEETGVVTIDYHTHHDDLETFTIVLTPRDEP